MDEEVYDMVPIKTENMSEEELNPMTLAEYADQAALQYMDEEYYESGDEGEMDEDGSHSPFDEDLLLNPEEVEAEDASELMYGQSSHQQHFSHGNQVQYVQHHIESRQILEKRLVTTVSQPAKQQPMLTKKFSNEVDLLVAPGGSKAVNFHQSNVSPRQPQQSLVKVTNQPVQHKTLTKTHFSPKSPVPTISTTDVCVQRIMTQIKQSNSQSYQQSKVHIQQQQIQRHTQVQQHVQQENISVRQVSQQKALPNQGVQTQQQLIYSQQENVRRVVRPPQIAHQPPQGPQEIKPQVRPAQQQQQAQAPVQQVCATNVRVTQVAEQQNTLAHPVEEQIQTPETPRIILPDRFKNLISVTPVHPSPNAVRIPVQITGQNITAKSPGLATGGVKRIVIQAAAGVRPKTAAVKGVIQAGSVGTQSSQGNASQFPNQSAALAQPGLSVVSDEIAPQQKFRESPQSQSVVPTHPQQHQQIHSQQQVQPQQQQPHQSPQQQQQTQQVRQQAQQSQQTQQQQVRQQAQPQQTQQQVRQQVQPPQQTQQQQVRQQVQPPQIQQQPVRQQGQQPQQIQQQQVRPQAQQSQQVRQQAQQQNELHLQPARVQQQIQRQQHRKIQPSSIAGAGVMSPRLPNSSGRGRFPTQIIAVKNRSPVVAANVKQLRMSSPAGVVQNRVRMPVNFLTINNGGRSPVSGARSPMTSQSPHTPVTTNLNQHVTLTSIPSTKTVTHSFMVQTSNVSKSDAAKARALAGLNVARSDAAWLQDLEVQMNEGNIYVSPEELLNYQNEQNHLESSSESEHSGNDSELDQEEREALQEDIPTPPKSPDLQDSVVKRVPGYFGLCTFCGYLSLNMATCERCRRKLPDEIKMVPTQTGNSGNIGNIIITSVKDPNTPQPVPPPTATQMQQLQQVHQKIVPAKQGPEVKKTTPLRNVQPQVAKKKRVNRKKNEEPECLTISSDEESPEPAAECGQPVILRDPVVSNATRLKEPVITDEHESEKENITQGVKGGGLPETDIDQLLNGSPENEYTLLQCRTVRVGSYKVVPKDHVLLSPVGVKILVPSLEDSNVSVALNIRFEEIIRVLIHFGKQMPVLFLYISPSAGAEIRKVLKMETKEGHYFDPTSKDETHKRITLLPEKITDDSRAALKNIFSSDDKGSNKFEELSAKEANDILVRASPKEVQKALKQTSSSSGGDDVIRPIMAYPAPPATEGIMINTQDYACLGEDQFLNDVIIDFYLKYLTLQVLTPEDRERTHVFSSFFYQRLTKASKALKGSNANKDKVGAAKMRHNRVCRWTKKIDLFSKDFIIIPINENSHWFLAIICYPGLEGPVSMNDDSPAPPMPSVPRRKNKDELCSNSMTIGSTTITPVGQSSPQTNTTITITPDADGKDEAESEDEDISMHSSDEDSSESNEVRSSQSSQQLSVETSPSISTSTPKPKPVAKVKHEKREPIKQPCILIFDSLAMCNKRSRVVATLRDYLRIEYEMKHPGKERKFNKDTFKGASPKVPQQDNFTDCGLFVLQYVESFFECPIEDYTIPIKSLKNWFNPDLVARKRYQIQQLLHQLMAEQNINYKEFPLPELNLRPDGLPSKPLVDYSDSNGGDMEGMEEGMDEGMDDGMEEGLGEEEEDDFDDEDLDDEMCGEGEDETESDSTLFNSSNSLCAGDKITPKEFLSVSVSNSGTSNVTLGNVSVTNLSQTTLARLKTARIVRKTPSASCQLSNSLTITTTTAPSDNAPPAAKKIRSDYDSA